MPDFWHRSFDVFVSHAHEDAAEARRVTEFLREQGLRVWLDKDELRVGEEFHPAIRDAIADSSVLLLLVSRVTASKEYVRHELSCAYGLKRRLALLFLENIPADALNLPAGYEARGLHGLSYASDTPARAHSQLAVNLKEMTRWASLPDWLRVAAALAVVALIGFVGWKALTRKSPDAREVAEQVALLLQTRDWKPERASSTTPGVTPVAATRPPSMAFTLYGSRAGAPGFQRLRDGDTLASGDQYALRVDSPTGGWLYVYQIDSLGKTDWIFPKNPHCAWSTGSNPVPADQPVVLPQTLSRAYSLDQSIGTEHFFAVLFPQRWLELENLLSRPTNSVPAQPLSPETTTLLASTLKGLGSEVPAHRPRTTERPLPTLGTDELRPPETLREAKAGWLWDYRYLRHVEK